MTSAEAAVRDILPGGGDGTHGERGAFACNVLLRPPSLPWGLAEAAVTAASIHEPETWACTTHGPG